jgi:urease subunit alpha
MTCEPTAMRPQWGAFGRAKQALSASFVSRAAFERDIKGRLGLEKTVLPVGGVRKLNKRHMLHNDACPQIRVNPETFEVFVNGEVATCEPATVLPLAQRYMLR